MTLRIGIDVGGTFTDVSAWDEVTRQVYLAKVSSTPAQPDVGFWAGVDEVIKSSSSGPGAIQLAHGTTVATNSLVQRAGARIGVLTTRNFEDVLFIGREGRTEMYGVDFEEEVPGFLCRRSRVVGLNERIAADGSVLRGLDEAEVTSALEYLVNDAAVQSIAVCTLFSYVNPDHELRIEAAAAKLFPSVPVYLSSRISPHFREYERTVVTAFCAYLGPLVGNYLERLRTGAAARDISNPIKIMQSSGGLTSSVLAQERPVVTLLSGPSAGVAGAAWIARSTGRRRVLSMDMGGTSNDVAVILDGAANMSNSGRIHRYPLSIPMQSVSTVGAGGGSIATVDAAGLLKVGPESAGAVPGPACYGLGGGLPTVTDASLVLGYLSARGLGSSEVRLDRAAAQAAIDVHVADKIGLDTHEAARGIHDVLVNSLADQLRLVTMGVGLDPRDFSLVAFGGSGPVVGGRLLGVLGLREVIVPPRPGVLSALGLLLVGEEHEEETALMCEASDVTPGSLERDLQSLRTRCYERWQWITEEPATTESTFLDIRYRGQSYELRIPFRAHAGLSTEDLAAVVAEFHERHQSLFGHSDRTAVVEFVAVRFRVERTPTGIPDIQTSAPRRAGPLLPAEFRQSFFDTGVHKTPVYQRETLEVNDEIYGPAIIDQLDTTTVIYPGQVGRVDQFWQVIISAE
jgi:N-methylhydantoinase A